MDERVFQLLQMAELENMAWSDRRTIRDYIEALEDMIVLYITVRDLGIDDELIALLGDIQARVEARKGTKHA